MSHPTFSVIVPAHGTAAVVDEAIDSVLAQTRADWELVVVDDCSPDDVADRVARRTDDARIHLHRLAANRGVSAARNAGVAVSRGTYVTFLDSDDVVRADFLEATCRAFEQTPETALVGVRPAHIDVEGVEMPDAAPVFPELPRGDPEATLLHLLRWFHYGGATLPRAVFDEVGGFDETLWMGEDRELWVRAALTGRPIVVLAEPLYTFRARAGSVTTASTPGRSVELARGTLDAVDRIAAHIGHRPARVEALARFRRVTEGDLAAASFREAAREGASLRAREQARRLVALEPGARARAMLASSYLPGPMLRVSYHLNRRRRGLAPPEPAPTARP